MSGVFTLAVLIALQYTPSVRNCAWGDIDHHNAAQLVPEFFNYADSVVHGRVEARLGKDGRELAQVTVLRAFKGGDSPMQISGQSGWCGHHFSLGEERVYFVKEGVVSAAGAKEVSPWLLVALNGVARTVAKAPQTPVTEVRVRNGSNVMLLNVVVGSKDYGDIMPGDATPYMRWRTAYRHSSFSLYADGRVHKRQVFCHMGESHLGGGRFTYVLSYEDGQVEIRAETDEKGQGVRGQ